MQPWKTLERRILLAHSKYLTVEEHRVQLPNGQEIHDWPWLVTPDFVNVVLVDTAGRFIVFRQTKYAADGESLAPVGGYVEPGEAALPAAQREVLEETGYQAAHWQDLGRYPVDGNRGAGSAYLYLATGAARVAEANADDLEEQELLLLTRAEVEAALRAGHFKILPWAAAMSLALLHLDSAS